MNLAPLAFCLLDWVSYDKSHFFEVIALLVDLAVPSCTTVEVCVSLYVLLNTAKPNFVWDSYFQYCQKHFVCYYCYCLRLPWVARIREKRYIQTEVNALNGKMPIIKILAFFLLPSYFLALSWMIINLSFFLSFGKNFIFEPCTWWFKLSLHWDNEVYLPYLRRSKCRFSNSVQSNVPEQT